MLYRRTRGFTLIEVLMAMLLIAVGGLGAAALHAQALRLRQHSALSADAIELAAALAARIRVNPGAATGVGATYLDYDYDSATGAPSAPASQCFGAADCSPDQLAAFDLFETARSLHAAFPGGRIVLCRDASPWRPAQAALVWDCDRDATAPLVVKIGWRSRSIGAPESLPFVSLVVSG